MELEMKFESLLDFINLIEYDSMSDIVKDAKTNWLKGSAAITDMFNNLSLYIEPLKFQRDLVPDLTGLFFDVGLVCSGIPESWLNPKLPTDNSPFHTLNSTEEDEQKIVNLGLNVTVSSDISEDSIIERGAAMAYLAYLLEQSGRTVTLTQYCASSKDFNTNFYGSLVLKSADEQLDINKLSFWLTCPAVLRKCWARILEVLPNMRKDKFERPFVEHGQTSSNIFMKGLNSKSSSWNRETSIEWIKQELEKQKINYTFC